MSSVSSTLIGLFCLLLGSLILVAPHKLAGASFEAVQPVAPALGVLLISGGMMLVGTSLLGVSRPLFMAAHLVIAVALAPGDAVMLGIAGLLIQPLRDRPRDLVRV